MVELDAASPSALALDVALGRERQRRGQRAGDAQGDAAPDERATIHGNGHGCLPFDNAQATGADQTPRRLETSRSALPRADSPLR